jgi:uncharacterized protein (TIGR02246 family)
MRSLALLLLLATAAPAFADYADDRAEIENLLSRYLYAMDFRDPKAYASVFTEDGVLESGRGVTRGRDALRKMLADFNVEMTKRAEAAGRTLRASRHVASNFVIKVDGDKATAVSYWTAHRVGNDGKSVEPTGFGHYEDELVRRNGEWLIARRVVFAELIAGREAKSNPVH